MKLLLYVFLPLFLIGCFPDYIDEEYVKFIHNIVNELNSHPQRQSLGFPLLQADRLSNERFRITYEERIVEEGFTRKIISIINDDEAAYMNCKDPSYWENERTLYLVQLDSEPRFPNPQDPIFGLRIVYGLGCTSPKYHKIYYGVHDIIRFNPMKINKYNTTTEKDFVQISKEEALKIKEILMTGNKEDLEKLYMKEYQNKLYIKQKSL